MTLDDMDDIMEQGESMDGLEVSPGVNAPPRPRAHTHTLPRPNISRTQGDGAAMQLDFDDDEDFGGDDGDLYGDFEL